MSTYSMIINVELYHAACPCDPGGTVGDCDSLFGTCVCQPGATGQLCNECIDGYWGVSQGCIPCDCCTEGTVGSSNVCDKVYCFISTYMLV